MDFHGYFRKRHDPKRGMQRSAAQRNVRPLEDIHNQQSPDPSTQGGAWGEIRSRPARIQVFTTFYDSDFVSEDRFGAEKVGVVQHAHRAWVPAGGMTPFTERSNIQVPVHVAYGSLFDSESAPYGYG